MIEDTVFDSFYIIEFEGVLIKDFIAGDYGIKQISFASAPFASDLDAAKALDLFINDAAFNVEGGHNAVVAIDYNPTFFPTMPAKTLTLEEELDIEALNDEANKSIDSSHVAVVLTRVFDPIGDFIESRITVTDDKFKIIGKIGVDPESFLKSLGEIKSNEMDMFISSHPAPMTVGIH